MRGAHVSQLLSSLDSSDDLVLITSIEGPISYINLAGLRLLGIDALAPAMSMRQFRPRWASQYTLKVVLPQARVSGQWSGESVLLNRDGAEIPVRQSLYIIPATQGQSEGILLIAREITDSDQESYCIENYDEYYRLFFQKSEEAIYLLNAATKRVLYANPAFFKYLGYAPEDLRNLYIYDFVFHEKQSIDGFLAQVWEKQEMHIGERQWKRKDGSVIYVFISLTLLAPQGIPVYVITARDISQEVEARQKLLASERRYQQLVEHLNDGLLHVDVEDRIVFVNARLCELTGYAPKELLGKYASRQLLNEAGQAFMAERLAQRKTAPLADQYEIQIVRKSGEIRWFQNSSTRLIGENGEVLGSIGLLRDIHQQKETERQLQYKMRELDTFVYKASHDLKAPLNSLQGLLDLAQADNPDATMGQYLSLMRKKTAKLHSVLMGLLEVSVMQEGRVNRHAFALRDFCREIFESFEQVAAERGIELRCTIPDDVVLVSDRKILESVVQNLVHNAVNYHRPTGADRYVELATAAAPNQRCLFVTDNGPGIPDDIQDKVFDMFYRGSNDSEGSGLGLYIVKTGAEKLGGRVKMTSQVGQGTSFEVVVPEG